MALKERLASSSETTSSQDENKKRYVTWEEKFVSMDKGRREVRYFLKKKSGELDLALIGKEKSSRHMSYHYAIRNSSFAPFFRLKSRTQVVNWLDSIVQDSSSRDANMAVEKHGYEPDIGTLKENQLQTLHPCSKEFTWLGLPWTCRKRRNHYQAFRKNGFQISVYDFVFVLAEENKRLVAYLEDMYEGSKGNKMVVVRWFHRIDEVGFVLPHSFSEREVYFSPYLQRLSIECIDGLASVLSPQHYAKYRNKARHARPEPFVCSKKFGKDDVKDFDITQMEGYWKQEILKQMYPHVESNSSGSSGKSDDGPELEENLHSSAIRPKKKQRCTKVDGKDAVELGSLQLEKLSNCKIDAKTSSSNKLEGSVKLVGTTKLATIKETNEASQYLAVGCNVEVLSQDSGIRGCWFRASVIKRHKDKVKVQYHDIQDAEDEAKKLEEWILASRPVVPDDLGLRVDERTKIRPLSEKRGISFVGDVGYIVDAWWHDGWWEGIVVQKESDDKYYVYFPGEKKMSIFAPCNLRHSRDWTGNGWVKVRERPDVVTCIASSLKTKQSSCKSEDSKSTVASMGDGIQSRQADTYSGFSEKDKLRKTEEVPDLVKDVLSLQLRWKSSRKRNRSGTSQQKQQSNDIHRKLSPKFLQSDATDSFVVPASLKVDHDDYKYQGDPSLFSSSVVPSLTNMVMCR